MNALEVEDFIMTNELNWHPAGYKSSKGIMKKHSIWTEWEKTKKTGTYSDYIKATVLANNKNGEFDAFKMAYFMKN